MKEKIEEILLDVINDARNVWSSHLEEDIAIESYTDKILSLFNED